MLRAIGWTLLAAILALGGAGLVADLSHTPGDDRRAELTWAADVALAANLDDIGTRLEDVGAQVDALSNDARLALAAVSSGDTSALATALDQGAARAAQIDAAVQLLRATFAGLPGTDPAAATAYSNSLLVRRAVLGAAVEAVETLSDEWLAVSARSADAATLTEAIVSHDKTLAAAATAGVQARWTRAVELCRKAVDLLDQIAATREDAVQDNVVTVLDDWLARNGRHDAALLDLYKALKASGGKRNPTVDAAYREEQVALGQLPPDNRAIIVIIADVAANGLNQAVVAIEDARGRIDQAIAEATPAQ